MKVVSIAEMRRIDESAQTRYGLDPYDLMSEAGRAVAESCIAAYDVEKICVLCGKGNNAGDGFAAACVLHEMGRSVTVVCLEPKSAYTGAARKAWDRLVETKIRVVARAKLTPQLQAADIVIDAILGTGISGTVRGEYAAVIREVNSCGRPVVSIDVPSGLRELKPGEETGEVIQAALTLTVGLPKTMLLTLPGRSFSGRLITLPINFPKELLESDDLMLNWASQDEQAGWLPVREPDSNKGTYGNVGIIGSCASYAGATLLVARAALRSGCGLAAIYTLAETNAIFKTALPEATSIILAGGKYGFFDDPAGRHFASCRKEHSIITMGPGLGTERETIPFVKHVLSAWSEPLLLDADALNILSEGMLDCLKGRDDVLLTPHPGEMARLLELSVKDVQTDRTAVARDFAVTHQVNVLLKGAGTLLARPDGQVWLIPGAEPALAKGGTGDVLTGVIASLYAQGLPMWQAAVLGASVHLQAGRLCAEKFGSRGVLAGEVADAIPLVLDRLHKKG